MTAACSANPASICATAGSGVGVGGGLFSGSAGAGSTTWTGKSSAEWNSSVVAGDGDWASSRRFWMSSETGSLMDAGEGAGAGSVAFAFLFSAAAASRFIAASAAAASFAAFSAFSFAARSSTMRFLNPGTAFAA